VGRGEAELAIQPISKLMEVLGIEVVGPLPAELQSPDLLFHAASPLVFGQPSAPKELIDFPAAPANKAVDQANGLEPG